MGMFDKMKGVFNRKKNEPIPIEPPLDLEPIPLIKSSGSMNLEREQAFKEPLAPRESLAPTEPYRSSEEKAEITNVRAKLDLLLTEMDSIKTQNQMINERLKAIEKALAEMRGIRYY